MLTLAVALAGGLGAVARFTVDGVVRSRQPGPVPWGTLLINLTGSFLLGVLTGAVLFGGEPTALTVVASTGFCGGYTTFSTASFEIVRLVQQRRYRTVALVAAVNLLGCPAAAAASLALASGL